MPVVMMIMVYGLYVALLLVMPASLLAFKYVLTGLSLYKLAKRRGIANAGLAWVPVANNWLLGSIADDYYGKKFGKEAKLRTMLLIIACVSVGGSALAYVPLMTIPVIGVLYVAGLVLPVLQYLAYYRLYASCEPQNSLVYLIMSILLPAASPVLLLICSKSDEGMPEQNAD